MTSPTSQQYCIDSTEVTQAQYAEFLAASPTPTAQAECSWNTTFVPETVPNAKCFLAGSLFDPDNTPDYPVVCVDWCDAQAYCAWAGKRLCGRVGGGATDPNKLADASESEWFNACSFNGTLAYPYGDVFEPESCHDAFGPQPFAYTAGPSSAFPGCEGGFPGLFQMSGNVYEWEAGCTGNSGPNDACPGRGGSAASNAKQLLRCDNAPSSIRDTREGQIGIRCCASNGS